MQNLGMGLPLLRHKGRAHRAKHTCTTLSLQADLARSVSGEAVTVEGIMCENGTTHPPVLWAQRNDTILLTISVNDLHNEKYTVNDKTLKFYGEGTETLQKYEFELEFFKEITPQESKHSKTARGLFFVLKKKESGPYWPRLLQDTKKVAFIKTDFNRWRDESDSDSDTDSHDQDSNLQAMMQQMGGLGGGGVGDMGAMAPDMDDLEDGNDSDDEPVPGLET